MGKVLKWRLYILCALILILAVSIFVLVRENKSVLKVVFLNIGQGDAIFIEAPGGNQLLIDAGPGRSTLRELSKMMPFYDRTIDVVLATHPDADHIGGFLDVLDTYKVDLYIESGVEGETSLVKELTSKIEKLSIKKLEVRKGMVVDLGRGAVLEILFPVNDPRGMETNTASIVARLVYGENEFLLTGDSPINIENYLVSLDTEGHLLQSDVLKAGHHGSRTSTSQTFVAAVDPNYVVISAGKDNRYGHPHQEVLDILNNFGAKILRTDLDGRIIFESDGVNLKVK